MMLTDKYIEQQTAERAGAPQECNSWARHLISALFSCMNPTSHSLAAQILGETKPLKKNKNNNIKQTQYLGPLRYW